MRIRCMAFIQCYWECNVLALFLFYSVIVFCHYSTVKLWIIYVRVSPLFKSLVVSHGLRLIPHHHYFIIFTLLINFIYSGKNKLETWRTKDILQKTHLFFVVFQFRTVLCLFHLKWFCANCWALGLIKLIVISYWDLPVECCDFKVRFNYVLVDSISKLINMFCFLFQYWFQNRRAKSRKLERKMTSGCQTTPSNQFDLLENRVAYQRRLQFVNRSLHSDHSKQAEYISYPLMEESSEDQQYGRPIRPARRRSSVQSNQFTGDLSCPLPLFHPDQFQIRPAAPARLPYSRVSRRFQPYWSCMSKAIIKTIV